MSGIRINVPHFAEKWYSICVDRLHTNKETKRQVPQIPIIYKIMKIKLDKSIIV